MVEFETDRLRIRRFRMDEAEAMAGYRSDPEVSRWVPWSPPYPVEKARELIGTAGARAGLERGAWSLMAIERRVDGALIGDCVVKLNGEDGQQALVGYVVDRAHHGHGYATEVVRGLVGVLFETHRLHRLSAYVCEENRVSQHVLEKVGFRREAHFVEGLLLKGAWVSEFLYAILRCEWDNAARS